MSAVQSGIVPEGAVDPQLQHDVQQMGLLFCGALVFFIQAGLAMVSEGKGFVVEWSGIGGAMEEETWWDRWGVDLCCLDEECVEYCEGGGSRDCEGTCAGLG